MIQLELLRDFLGGEAICRKFIRKWSQEALVEDWDWARKSQKVGFCQRLIVWFWTINVYNSHFQLLLLVLLLFFLKGNVYTVGFELILGHAFSEAVSFSPYEEAGLLSSLPTKGHGCFHVRLRVGRHRDDMQQCQSFGELSIPSIPCHGDLL